VKSAGVRPELTGWSLFFLKPPHRIARLHHPELGTGQSPGDGTEFLTDV